MIQLTCNLEGVNVNAKPTEHTAVGVHEGFDQRRPYIGCRDFAVTSEFDYVVRDDASSLEGFHKATSQVIKIRFMQCRLNLQ